MLWFVICPADLLFCAESTFRCRATHWRCRRERAAVVSVSRNKYSYTTSLPNLSCRFHTDPSGTFMKYEAKAIGSGSEAAQSELQDKWHKVRYALI
jgi:hypothetical protein